MAEPAPSRRCSICALDWPDNYAVYGKCPECEQPTDRITNGHPMDATEAKSRKNHADFERFYETWNPQAAQMDALDRRLSAA